MGNEARPWDIFLKSSEKITEEMKKIRLDMCNQCEFLIKKVNICKQCGCNMNAKAELASAECPIGKWGKYKYSDAKETQ